MGRSGPNLRQEQAVHGVVVLAVVGQGGLAEAGKVAGLGVPPPGALDALEEGGHQIKGQVAGPGHGAAGPAAPGASAVPAMAGGGGKTNKKEGEGALRCMCAGKAEAARQIESTCTLYVHPLVLGVVLVRMWTTHMSGSYHLISQAGWNGCNLLYSTWRTCSRTTSYQRNGIVAIMNLLWPILGALD